MNAQSPDFTLVCTTDSELTQLDYLIKNEDLAEAISSAHQHEATALVQSIRTQYKPSILEQFLRAYPLDTAEGLSLMTLAEAYQRVPDTATADALILDKLGRFNWRMKAGRATQLVRVATLGLNIGTRLLRLNPLRAAVLACIRTTVGAGMRLMGRAFVLGQTITGAQKKACKLESQGYTFSYDMLGEAAYTQADADRYYDAYCNALSNLIQQAKSDRVEDNPGISVKLSALHPRYDLFNREDAVAVLSERMLAICSLAKTHNIGVNIDAEECARLEISLEIIRTLIAAPQLAGWRGLGIVVQAYNRKAYSVLDQLYDWASEHDRQLMVRLVKGAYWDSEIKLAQEQGLDQFPVFSAKHYTDISYLACARKLIRYADRIYPQFATHNAHTAAVVLNWAREAGAAFEMQRLHGMGEALHHALMQTHKNACRIYAPVGSHKDLLAYLVRRLLENGANSSFVSQLADNSIPAAAVVTNPTTLPLMKSALPTGAELFRPRRNSRGYDLTEISSLESLIASRSHFMTATWGYSGDVQVHSPATGELLGVYQTTAVNEIDALVTKAGRAKALWRKQPSKGSLLLSVADLYERHTSELLALLTREAGKTLPDAVNEIREAVDFLRYYADQSNGINPSLAGRGIAICISPWNFPLAIFTGQIAAAVGAGNAVIAKPAEQTSLVARRAIELWHAAGMPEDLVQLVLGTGAQQGNALVSHPSINAVLFTGSTATAQRIERSLVANAQPETLLVAETGGLNAMIADASALPEQVVKAVIASAFQSAGQRCSALRMLYVQQEIYPQILTMLQGAMALLSVGDPSLLRTDLGPVIDSNAAHALSEYIEEHRANILFQTALKPSTGHFVPPTLIAVKGINDLDFERFGPILHIAPFGADQLEQVVEDINARGYGLTFAVQSRIQTRTEALCSQLQVGNCYINRNQIGAIVGSQPFGGEGLSGTGPKAGGPNYLSNLISPTCIQSGWVPDDLSSWDDLRSAWSALMQGYSPAARQLESHCPGVTGETNQLFRAPRGYWLVAGDEQCWQQAKAAAEAGNPTLVVCSAKPTIEIDSTLPIVHLQADLNPELIERLPSLAGVSLSAASEVVRTVRSSLANQPGAIRPVLTDSGRSVRHCKEQHICEDTTASGGNAALMMSSSVRDR